MAKHYDSRLCVYLNVSVVYKKKLAITQMPYYTTPIYIYCY